MLPSPFSNDVVSNRKDRERFEGSGRGNIFGGGTGNLSSTDEYSINERERDRDREKRRKDKKKRKGRKKDRDREGGYQSHHQVHDGPDEGANGDNFFDHSRDFSRDFDTADSANNLSPLQKPLSALNFNDTQNSTESGGYRADFYGNTPKKKIFSENLGAGGGSNRNHRGIDRSDNFESDQKLSEKKLKKLKRQKRKQEKAALSLQMAWRCRLARVVAKRIRRRNLFALAAQSGVLLACEGTKQGETGWYQQNEDSIPVYYEVDAQGRWKLVM